MIPNPSLAQKAQRPITKIPTQTNYNHWYENIHPKQDGCFSLNSQDLKCHSVGGANGCKTNQQRKESDPEIFVFPPVLPDKQWCLNYLSRALLAESQLFCSRQYSAVACKVRSLFVACYMCQCAISTQCFTVVKKKKKKERVKTF